MTTTTTTHSICIYCADGGVDGWSRHYGARQSRRSQP